MWGVNTFKSAYENIRGFLTNVSRRRRVCALTMLTHTQTRAGARASFNNSMIHYFHCVDRINKNSEGNSRCAFVGVLEYMYVILFFIISFNLQNTFEIFEIFLAYYVHGWAIHIINWHTHQIVKVLRKMKISLITKVFQGNVGPYGNI